MAGLEVTGVQYVEKAASPVVDDGNAGSLKGDLTSASLLPDSEKDTQDDICEWVDDGDNEEEERIALRLVGKLWSDRILNPTAFMATIKNVWVTQNGVDVKMIGKNLYQFQFYY